MVWTTKSVKIRWLTPKLQNFRQSKYVRYILTDSWMAWVRSFNKKHIVFDVSNSSIFIWKQIYSPELKTFYKQDSYSWVFSLGITYLCHFMLLLRCSKHQFSFCFSVTSLASIRITFWWICHRFWEPDIKCYCVLFLHFVQ